MAEQPPPGVATHKWAVLIDRFNCGPADIADLTDAQIDELFFYPRNRDGALVPPPEPDKPAPPPTAESRLATIDQLEALKIITPAKAHELRKQVHDGKKA